MNDAGAANKVRINQQLARYFIGQDGTKFNVMGDSIFAIAEQVVTPHRGRRNLTRAQKRFNTNLSKHRIAVEWLVCLI